MKNKNNGRLDKIAYKILQCEILSNINQRLIKGYINKTWTYAHFTTFW